MALRIPQPPRAGRGRRLVLWLAALGLLAWAILTLVTLVGVRRHTQAGVDKLERARDVITPTGLVEGEGVDLLRDAEADFRSARRGVRSLLVAPLRVLPVVGRQVRAVDAMTGAAVRVVDIGVDAAEAAGDELNGRKPRGRERVALARDLGDIAARSGRLLDAVHLGPQKALIGPVADARERFEVELANLRTTTGRMRDAAGGFGDFLEGPSRYLVLAANNAEMRVGSGTFLSVGVLTVANGDFLLGEMQPTRRFSLPQGAVPLTGEFADVEARWGWLAPNREWRNLASSPRFDVQGALAARMWKAATGEEVDGVLALDPVALKALLAATGPVVVDGKEINAENVVAEILLVQYIEFEGLDPDQQERRDRLSTIARAAIEKLDAGGWDSVDLIEHLRDAAEGRHVLAWSARPSQQLGWTSADIDGAVDDDSLLLAVHNRGGNKLDQFLGVRARATVATAEGDETEVRVRVELHNRTPETRLPRYVVGPFPGARGGAEGLYQGLLVAELPRLARDLYIEDAAGRRMEIVAAGSDGPAWVVSTYVEVARGESRAFVVHFRLPAGDRTLVVEPSARVPPVSWTFAGRTWKDVRSHGVTW